MKKNKKRKTIVFIAIATIILLSISTYFTVSFLKNNNSYSYAERNWLSDNTNDVIDIYIQNNLPVFSYASKGVFYDYLKDLEKDINVSFNIIYEGDAEYSMGLKRTDKNSIVFYKEHYVVISKNSTKLTSITDFGSKDLAILNADLDTVRQYLSDYKFSYRGYETFEDLKVAFSSGVSEYAIVPLYMAINDILEENYSINYHIDGFNAYYALTLSDNNEHLNSIMKKFYNRWEERATEMKNEHLVNFYYDLRNYSQIQKNEIIDDDYVVGYINNLPFEGIVNNTFTGLTSAYLLGLSDLSNATFKYKNYKSIIDLKEALDKNEVDIAANYYSITSNNYQLSTSFNTGEYVVLSHADNPIVFETFSTLTGLNIEMLGGINLTNLVKSRNVLNVIEHNSSKELFDSLDKDSIIMVEKDYYEYYKNSKFKNYVIKYSDNFSIHNNFLLKNSNSSFNDLFNFYLLLNSDNEMRSLSTQKLYSDSRSNIIISFIVNNIIYILLGIVAIGFVFYKLAHRIRLSKRIKKEDKLLYIDVMTNLKNRNYLNDNINYWSENKVYPQAIVMADLIKIKELNDRFGHEAGDKQIKAAANALIKTQRENSEIMRTNGNEFMVYLVGYEEKTILSYIHKLSKELNNSLPYKEYSVALGYAMIKNEQNTLDDAINDASKKMRENKGVLSEK